MSKRIFFDGFSLSLKRGTGIATYTRVLAGLAHDLGYTSGILYGRPSILPATEPAREAAFFAPEPRYWNPLRALSELRGVLPAIGGARAYNVPLSASARSGQPAPWWVRSDEVLVAPGVSYRTGPHLVLTGEFLAVKLPYTVDLFHWTYPRPITSNARANIYTIHDIIPLQLPHASVEPKKLYRHIISAMLAKADHIITVSEHSKRDIVRVFGTDEKRITNTYEAAYIPQRYLELTDDTVAGELDRRFGLEFRNYLLFYGSFEPKKNVKRVLQAYAAANLDMPLVVVVAQSWLASQDFALLDQLMKQCANETDPKRRGRIRRFEYLPQGELLTLIRGARAVVFPSIYEGFGLPILEGMMLGTPVITSAIPPMEEVAGGAAILVDPYDVNSIKNAMIALANDKDLCAALQKKGFIRAQFFAGNAYRERVAKVYAAFT